MRRTHYRTRLKLEPELRIWTRKTPMPRSDRIIPVPIQTLINNSKTHRDKAGAPFLHQRRLHMVHHAPIIIVPPDLHQLPCELIVSEHGIPRHWARAVE